MIYFIRQFLKWAPSPLRALFPAIGILGTLTMAAKPELRTLIDVTGSYQWFPLLVIGCYLVTLVNLISRGDK